MVKKETLNSATFKVSNADQEDRKYNITANATVRENAPTRLESGIVRTPDEAPVSDFSASATYFSCNINGEKMDRREIIAAILDFCAECESLTLADL